MSVQPRAKVYDVSERQKELTSKNLSRRQLVLYILDDLLRGLYLVGSLFLDGLIILQLFSFVPSSYLNKGPLSNFYVRDGLMGAVIAILEILVIYLEIKGFRRLWPKGAMYLGHKIDKGEIGK
ncbi:MAG: hypothetical protein QXU18_03640 [Thermoplasmatales archaeon]